MNQVDNIAELFKLSLEQMQQLLGPANGKELFEFVHK